MEELYGWMWDIFVWVDFWCEDWEGAVGGFVKSSARCDFALTVSPMYVCLITKMLLKTENI